MGKKSKTKSPARRGQQSARPGQRRGRRGGRSPGPGAKRSPPETGPDELTPQQRRFLAVVGQSANLTQAAELVGLNRSTHYHWLQQAAYRRAFLEARESALDRLEQEAWRRAHAGSDRLLVFLLSSYRPRFRQEAPPVGPVYHELAQMDEQELLAEAQRELRQLGYESIEELWRTGVHKEAEHA